MKINFNSIIEKAYETLILQDKLTFPLDVFNIKIKKNVKILTFSDLAELNQCTFNDIFLLSDESDALKYEKNNLILIAYNEKIENKNRIRWSIAHEYGHIVLNHMGQSDQNEVEANFFAANLLLPRCILKELIKKRDFVDKKYLQNKFGISKEASEKFFSNMSSRGFEFFENEYDDIILKKANKFIQRETFNSNKNVLQYEEEMQMERDKWLYE